LTLAANERSECDEKVSREEVCRCSRGWRRLRSACLTDGLKEKLTILLAQGQRFSEQTYCVFMWRSTDPTLKIADGANTHSRPFGQFLLRQAVGEPMLSEQLTKCRRMQRRHPASVLPLSTRDLRVATVVSGIIAHPYCTAMRIAPRFCR